jgi:hypothetical protein
MLRLRGDDRVAIITAPLSMTVVIGRVASAAEALLGRRRMRSRRVAWVLRRESLALRATPLPQDDRCGGAADAGGRFPSAGEAGINFGALMAPFGFAQSRLWKPCPSRSLLGRGRIRGRRVAWVPSAGSGQALRRESSASPRPPLPQDDKAAGREGSCGFAAASGEKSCQGGGRGRMRVKWS